MNDLLEIYEREAENREARTCLGCHVEAGSKRDNEDGRRVWFQFACDDMSLKPCSHCRPAEAIEWLRRHGELDWLTERRLTERAAALDAAQAPSAPASAPKESS